MLTNEVAGRNREIRSVRRMRGLIGKQLRFRRNREAAERFSAPGHIENLFEALESRREVLGAVEIVVGECEGEKLTKARELAGKNHVTRGRFDVSVEVRNGVLL
jgi:hypothetical protein